MSRLSRTPHTPHIPHPPHSRTSEHGDGGFLGEIKDFVHRVDGTVNDAREIIDDVTDIVSNVSAIARGVGTIIGDVKSITGGDPLAVLDVASQAAQTAQALLPKAFETPIIAAGLDTLSVMSMTLGDGDPDNGASFSDGAAQFNSAGSALTGAYPSTWEGTGAQAYSAQNTEQVARTASMIDTDNHVAQVLDAEALQIATTRRQMDAVSAMLGLSIAPAAMAMLDPLGGEAMSIGIQVAAVATAMAGAGSIMGSMAANAARNAAQLRQATGSYQSVGSQALPSGSDLPAVPGAPNTLGFPRSPRSPAAPETPGGISGGSGGSSAGSSGGSGGRSDAGSHEAPGGGIPSMPTLPTSPDLAGSSGGSTGAAGGGMPSSAGMPASTSDPGGSGGLLGGLVSLAARAAQLAGRAQQNKKTDPDDQKDAAEKDAAQKDHAPSDPEAAAGPDSPAGRAPIHVTVDDGAHHVEWDIQPDEVKGPVHVSLDPSNPTARPRITTA